jgi:hypothetical protein
MSLEQANISYRLTVQLWECDEDFAATVAMIKETQMAREFAIFSNDNHTPPPLPTMERRFEIIAKRIPVLQQNGWSAGINHLCTIGHTYENIPYAETGGQNFVNANGRICAGNYCTADPVWRENYIKPCYQMAAECRPEFIWIDDDVRLYNHGGDCYNHRGDCNIGCFCPDCLKRMSQYLDFKGTLKELPEFFEIADPDERRRRRMMLIDWNRRAMDDISAYIEGVVHAVDPNIILGQMDCYAPWCGLDLKSRAEALAGPDKKPVWWRPGGSFYFDNCPNDLLIKANNMGKEAVLLPDWVEVIQAEVENFNYQRLNKSEFFTCLEPQIYCAAGTTGVTYNVFAEKEWDKLEEYRSLAMTLNSNKEFLDRIVKGNRRTAPSGVFDGFAADILLMNNHKTGQWLSNANHPFKYFCNSELQKIGLPVAYRGNEASLYALGGGTAVSMSDAEIRTMLSLGVYLDGFALSDLIELGYGEYLGFSIDKIIVEDAIEELTCHALNGEYAKRKRNARQSFWHEPAYVLKPEPGAEVLSTYVDYSGAAIGECALGIYTNKLGGRIAVNGYYPWNGLFYRYKGVQLKNLFQWLSNGTLPGLVSSYHRASLWLREREGTLYNASLWNMSQDPARGLTLKLRTQAEELVAYEVSGGSVKVKATGRDQNYREFILPEIAPWSLTYCQM